MTRIIALAQVLVVACVFAQAAQGSTEDSAGAAMPMAAIETDDQADLHFAEQKNALIHYVECLKTAKSEQRQEVIEAAATTCVRERADYSSRLPEGVAETVLEDVDYRVTRDLER